MASYIAYRNTDKIAAAYLYASSGNYSQVSRDTKINRKTIMSWASDSDVWADALLKARQEISDELLAQNLAIAMAANVQVIDRIENGDYRLVQSKDANGKYHEQTRIPMTGKDLAVVSGIKEDKGRVSLGLATSISSNSASMSELQAQFESLAASHNRIESTVVSTQDDAETA